MHLKSLSIRSLQALMLVVFIAFSFGCRSDGSKSSGDDLNVEMNEEGDDIFNDINQAKTIFYSLPSPLETAMLIKTAGAKYNAEFLNPESNAGNYSTNKQMALNLGVYTTDLSFASLFDQTQTSITYMQAAKKMADGLGILEAIDNSTIERLEENVNNRDEIMNIISETFLTSSSTLQEDNRNAVASLVLVGGWVEGLYIATQLVGDAPIKGNKIVERIVDQKLSLDIVLRLLDENKSNTDVANVITEMQEMKKVYDKIIVKTSEIVPVVDETTKVTTLKSKTEITLTPEIFKELKETVKKIRTNFTL
ncbi:MAG: hypothetical protein U0T82_06790 [Bacteroidales bacterium]